MNDAELEKMAEEYSGLFRYIINNAIGIDPRSDIREEVIKRQGQYDGFKAGYKKARENPIRTNPETCDHDFREHCPMCGLDYMELVHQGQKPKAPEGVE